MKKTGILLTLLAAAVPNSNARKREHIADTPQMGWSARDKCQGDISEETTTGIADAMIASGLKEDGHTYINIGDCRHGKRDAGGFITVDAAKFPPRNETVGGLCARQGTEAGHLRRLQNGDLRGHARLARAWISGCLQYAHWGIDTTTCRVHDLRTRRLEGKTSRETKAVHTLTAPSHEVVAYRLIRQQTDD